ncbi:hypothetical protein NX059_009489 [Plenodomus lindquistii]|nr:hypothetical protein NX059_009489 [Plenodomus lindquistii]
MRKVPATLECALSPYSICFTSPSENTQFVHLQILQRYCHCHHRASLTCNDFSTLRPRTRPVSVLSTRKLYHHDPILRTVSVTSVEYSKKNFKQSRDGSGTPVKIDTSHPSQFQILEAARFQLRAHQHQHQPAQSS